MARRVMLALAASSAAGLNLARLGGTPLRPVVDGRADRRAVQTAAQLWKDGAVIFVVRRAG